MSRLLIDRSYRTSIKSRPYFHAHTGKVQPVYIELSSNNRVKVDYVHERKSLSLQYTIPSRITMGGLDELFYDIRPWLEMISNGFSENQNDEYYESNLTKSATVADRELREFLKKDVIVEHYT